MSLVGTRNQSSLVRDTNVRCSQYVIIDRYVRRSHHYVSLVLVNSITLQSSLQSDHVHFVFCRLSRMNVETKQFEVNCSCSSVCNRSTADFNPLAGSRASVDHCCRAVNVAIVSVSQLEACRIEVVACSCQSSCREFVSSRNNSIFTSSHCSILQ